MKRYGWQEDASKKVLKAYDEIDRLHRKNCSVMDIAVQVRRNTGVTMSLEMIRNYLRHTRGVTASLAPSPVERSAAALTEKIKKLNRAGAYSRFNSRLQEPKPETKPETKPARSFEGARAALQAKRDGYHADRYMGVSLRRPPPGVQTNPIGKWKLIPKNSQV